jgi:glycosyltransferase involved in cell wall biosynthesis
MKLAFVTTWDPHDPTIWAGTGYHMSRALQAVGCEIQHIGPLVDPSSGWLKAKTLLYRKVLKRSLHREREPAVLDAYARAVQAQLATSDAHIVFSPGTIPIAHLQIDRPIAFWTDATYAAVNETYRWELPTAAISAVHGHAQETEALRRAALAIYSSDWAAQSAIHRYHTDPAKVHVVPFGANIDVTRTREDIERLIAQRSRETCRLLFIGTGWIRKGGDVAVEVVRLLNEAGIDSELLILGRGRDTPDPNTFPPPFVRVAGFVDKRTPQGRARFNELFGTSHFLILPARAEAFGIVLCEAASFGVPALATRVGGIPTIVHEHRNGLLFNPEDAHAIADTVRALWSDRTRYDELARTSFIEYESRLNWRTAATRVKDLLSTLA